MKKVFLYAYDKQNLGDDLFIYTICNRYPKTKFYLWSDEQNKEIFKKVKNRITYRQCAEEIWYLRFLVPPVSNNQTSTWKLCSIPP